MLLQQPFLYNKNHPLVWIAVLHTQYCSSPGLCEGQLSCHSVKWVRETSNALASTGLPVQYVTVAAKLEWGAPCRVTQKNPAGVSPPQCIGNGTPPFASKLEPWGNPLHLHICTSLVTPQLTVTFLLAAPMSGHTQCPLDLPPSTLLTILE